MSETIKYLPEGEMGDKIKDIVEMLKTTGDGDMTITLAGAHAKGLDDEYSDIDIYMYYADPKPYETQKKIVEGFADNGKATVTHDHVSAPMGGYYIFNYKNTLVEVTTRLYENALKRINESVNGQFEILPESWTINGYYTFTYASEISYVKPMWDPPNFIENSKSIIYPYPQKFKKKLIEVFGERMKFNPCYNHEYTNAIRRRDLFMTNYFADYTLLNMIQVIYALNETYFTGDKQVARKIAKLPYYPVKMLENLEFLLGAHDDSEKLERQRGILREIVDELSKKCDELIWDN